MLNLKEQASAWVFTGVGYDFQKYYLPLPDPNDHELVVKITYTTLCSSDLHSYFGRRSSPVPCVLGHEIIGEIVALGDKIREDYRHAPLSVGDRITWSVYACEPDEEMTGKGIPQKSRGLYKYGHQKFSPEDGLNGGLATHCLLKKGTAVFKLPASLSAKEAAPLNCTHATVAGAVRLAGTVKGKQVLVTGAGMLGLSACAMAAESGASVTAMDINPARLALAEKFGASRTIQVDDDLNLGTVSLPGQKPEVVIDTTGIPKVMEAGISMLGTGGVAVWIGAVFAQEETKINAETVVRNILSIKGLHNYTPDDLGAALAFVESTHGKHPFSELVSAEFPLEDLAEAIRLAGSGGHFRVGINQKSK